MYFIKITKTYEQKQVLIEKWDTKISQNLTQFENIRQLKLFQYIRKNI